MMFPVLLSLVFLHGAEVRAAETADRRVMAWGSMDCFSGNNAVGCTGAASDNHTDIDRQAAEIELRVKQGALTDLSPTAYKIGGAGDIVWDRCGPVCEKLQPKFLALGLRVIPLVAAFGVGGINTALSNAEVFAQSAVNLTLKHGYAGINIDFEPMDCEKCQQPNNCTAETDALLRFLDVVVPALHAHGKEVQYDYAMWMQTHNFGSYVSLAASGLDRVISMDTYGKVPDVFSWILQFNMGDTCNHFPGSAVVGGGGGNSSCVGQDKLSVGLWPLSGGFSGVNETEVDQMFQQIHLRGARHVSVWDAFGETWKTPGVHTSIPDFWWGNFASFLKASWTVVLQRSEDSDKPLGFLV